MESILKRRSIRKYIDKAVSPEDIKNLLRAGMSAPSAVNQRPWSFIVVNDREKLNVMANYHPYAKMLKDAPLAIVVCATEELCKFKHFCVQDCSAATENILIAAQDKGLGSCWIGVYPVEEHIKASREIFNIPENVTPFCFISIGWPDETKKAFDRYDETRVHYNQW